MKIPNQNQIGRWLNRLIRLNILTLFFCTSTGLLHAQDDYEIIAERVIEYNKKLMSTSYLENLVDNALVLYTEGTVILVGTHTGYNNRAVTGAHFSNLDYSSRAQSGWELYMHPTYMQYMADVYTRPDSKYYNNPELFNKIEKLLKFWTEANVSSTNWWYQSIGVPKPMTLALLFMKYASSDKHVDADLEKAELERILTTSYSPESQKGPNKTDIATHYLNTALIKKDVNILKRAATEAFGPLKPVSTSEEGIQYDYSYFQHGKQLQIASYGAELINTTVAFLEFFAGTQYDIPSDRLEIFSKFVRETYFGTMRGQYVPYMLTGRGVTRSNSTNRSGNAHYAKSLMNYDAKYSAEYDLIAKKLEKNAHASEGITAFSNLYYIGDYIYHNRPGYQYSIRTVSSRTLRSEWGNDEGYETYFMSDGGSTILQDGDEYENIYGVWDWSKIPGVTSPLIQKGHIPNASGSMGNSPYGTHPFVGGVSDNVYSAYVYTMDDKWGTTNRKGKRVNINTAANKSWFMFDKEIVAVGSGLTSTATHADQGDLELITTVNQALLKGNILVGLTDGSVETLELGSNKEYYNAKWIVHNNIGYAFPSGGLVKVEAATKSGTWSEINATQSSTVYSRNLFALWLSHGKKAKDEKYSYLVVPNIRDAAEMQAYCDNELMNIEIIANDNSAQAIKHKSLGIWQIIFRKAGLFEHEDLKIKADQPCAVMIKDINIEDKTATMYVGDVMQYGNVLAFGIDIPGFTDKMKAVYVDNASSGIEKGKSIKIQLDSNLADYFEIEEPEVPIEWSVEYQSVLIADAYADQTKPTTNNGGSTEMVVKFDTGSSNRIGFIKAPLTDLDKIDDIDNYDINVSIDLCFMWANTGIDATAWTLQPVTGEWDEATLTYNNRPTWSNEIVGQYPSSALTSGSIVSIDISEYAIEQYKAGKNELSLAVYNSVAGSKVDAGFRTRENANEALKPKITVKGSRRNNSVVEYQSVLTADTHVQKANPATNYGGSGYMSVKKTTGTTNKETFIKAPLTDLDKISDLDKYDVSVSINLYLRWTNTDIAKTSWTLQPVTGEWDEMTITFNNKPTWSDEIVGRTSGFPYNSDLGSDFNPANVVSIDISKYAIEQYKAGKRELSLLVYNDVAVDRIDTDFATKEYDFEAARPKIIIKARKHDDKTLLDTKTSNVIHDAYVKNGNGTDINYGNDADLQVNTGGAGWHREAYLKFSLEELKNVNLNKYDVEVYMSLYQFNSQNEADKSPWNVRWVPNNNWTESSITWNNSPGAIDKIIASLPGFINMMENDFQDKYIAMFDITQYALALTGANVDNISFNIRGAADAGSSSKYASFFASKEYKLNGVDVDERTVPKLIIKLYEKDGQTASSTTWSPQNGSTIWSDPSNWTDGVPGTITKVIIPKSESYPILTEATEVQTIYFEAGSELGRQDLLTYEKAFIDYDFGKGNRSIHFHTLSLPLQEAYPGDFTFGGQPDTYIQTLSVDENGRGKWTTLSGGTSTAFAAGTGFALSLDPDKDAGKGLSLSEGILRLPFFDADSGVAPLVHPNHSYNAWTSTFTNPYGAGSYNVTRSANSYKLAGAEVSVNPQFGQSGSTIIALVGNPFMRTIDFSALHTDNASLIKNNYQIWTKSGNREGYAGYSPEGNYGLVTTPEMDNLISPLQGFIVERNGETTGSLDFNLLNIASAQSGVLKSAVSTGDKLNIIAKNEKASVQTFIAKREGGSVEFGSRDARKLINNLTEVPDIYTLKPSDKGMVAVGANIVDSYDIEYPLGLATTYSGNITLTFSGMDSYFTKIFFTDKELKKTVELTGLDTYEYTFNYAPVINGETAAVEDRFSLRLASATSGIEEELTDSQSLTVYVQSGYIHARSNDTEIKEMKVYNLNGSMIYYKSGINSVSYATARSFSSGVYIVEVKTDKGVERKKIIITNI